MKYEKKTKETPVEKSDESAYAAEMPDQGESASVIEAKRPASVM